MKRKWFRVSALLMLCLSGCGFVSVKNTTDRQARVWVKVPDTFYGTYHSLGPGESFDIETSFGGRYEVSVLAEGDYRKRLEDLRVNLVAHIFLNEEYLDPNVLAGDQFALSGLDGELNRLTQNGIKCSAVIQDNQNAYAVIGWDSAAQQWTAACRNSNAITAD